LAGLPHAANAFLSLSVGVPAAVLLMIHALDRCCLALIRNAVAAKL